MSVIYKRGPEIEQKARHMVEDIVATIDGFTKEFGEGRAFALAVELGETTLDEIVWSTNVTKDLDFIRHGAFRIMIHTRAPLLAERYKRGEIGPEEFQNEIEALNQFIKTAGYDDDGEELEAEKQELIAMLQRDYFANATDDIDAIFDRR